MNKELKDDAMRILWVKGGKLLPVDTGGKIRSYNILRQLDERHELTLVTYYGGKRDAAYENEIKKQFAGAVPVYTGAPDEGLISQGLNYLRRLPSTAPYAVTKFTSPKVQRVVKDLLDADSYDVAICDFLAASLNFPRELQTPTVLFQHNVESILWQRQSQHEPSLIKRMVFKLEAAKMARYESKAVNRFDHVIAVSEVDRDEMSRMTDASRISVVPTGVDLKQYSAAAGCSALEPLVVFVGSMDWEANIDGVDYFCREVWPSVKSQVPRARLRLVGRDPHPRVKRWASDTIEVTGTVPSVIEHLKEAAVVIVPLRIGGGTRLKIYEAMAMGKAVVSTSIGAEGLDVNHARDILLEDTADGFAGAVIKLLKDDGLRRQIENAAARQAARFDWSIIARRFEDVLAQVANAPEAMSEPGSAVARERATAVAK